MDLRCLYILSHFCSKSIPIKFSYKLSDLSDSDNVNIELKNKLYILRISDSALGIEPLLDT